MTRLSTGETRIVEDQEDCVALSILLMQEDRVWVRPVMKREGDHPASGALSLVYVCGWETGSDAIIPVDHHEAMPAPEDALRSLRTAEGVQMLCKDRAALEESLGDLAADCVDVSLAAWWDGSSMDLGRVLRGAGPSGVRDDLWHAPVYAIADLLRGEAEAARDRVGGLDMAGDSGFRVYNDQFIPALAFLESEGIAVDEDRFHRYFGEKGDRQVRDGLVHPRYYMYTSTGRPSNAFQRVNYAALEKGEQRTSFVSRYPGGRLFELDYDGFHLRLIADLVEYDLGDGSVHEHLGMRYFGTDQLTDEQYSRSKTRSFSWLYGGIPKDALQYEYFRRTQALIDDQWELYNRQGSVQTFGCGRSISGIESPTPNKVFNYLLQSYETEVALRALSSLRDRLDGVSWRPRVCLYTYDSFLLDVPPGCEGDVETIRDILSYGGRYPVDVQSGPDYGSLQPDDTI
jgi:hypothetical protein